MKGCADSSSRSTAGHGGGDACAADAGAAPVKQAARGKDAAVRVLFLTRKWPPAIGGMEAYCRELTRALEERVDIEVRALPGRADGRPPSAAAIVRFGLATGFRLILRRADRTVVHGGDLSVWPLVWLARLRARRSAAVLSAHGTDIALAHRKGGAARLYAAYLRLANRFLPDVTVLANSRATAELCRQAGFAAVEIVPLAVPASATRPAAPEPYVLFFGRLIRRKGCAWFIREVLPKLDPGLRLVVAGTVWDEEEKRALRGPRVEYVGPVSPDDRDRLSAAATSVVVPNIDTGAEGFEGFGLAATEAAAAGGVALAARLHGLTDAVIDGETGFLLPAGDAAAWAAKIEEIAAWPAERRSAFTARSRERVAEVYAWQRVAEQTLAVYGAALS